MAYRKSKGWGQTKPPVGFGIDWGDPLNTGLLYRYLINEGGGAIRDLVRGSVPTLSGTSWSVGKYGQALSSAGTGTPPINFGTSDLIKPTTAISFGCWFKKNSSSVSGVTLNASSDLVSLTNKGYAIHPYSDATIYCDIGNGTTIGRVTSPYVANTDYFACGTFDGSTVRLYVNGVLKGSAALTGPIVYEAGVTSCFGSAVASYKYAGLVSQMLLYNRALSAAEVMRLYTEPFAGIVTPRIWLPSAAAAPAAFSPFWAYRNSLTFRQGKPS